jgi:hypothetical protein
MIAAQLVGLVDFDAREEVRPEHDLSLG